MPGRSFSTANGYRYGFNGKENDSEVKGIEGSQQDYGMRIYDPRLGRFLSVDPLAREYPDSSVYAFAENGPIENIDRDGEERLHFTISGYNKDGTAILTNPVKEDIKDREFDWVTLSWKTVTNQRVEYVIHSGVVHHGAVNGTSYFLDIDFTYKNAEDFIEKGMKLTYKDVLDRVDFYREGDKWVTAFDNAHQEYKESRPGKSKGVNKDDSRGTYAPNRKLPRKPHGTAKADDEAVNYRHTQLGIKNGRKGTYTQARELDANGNPVRDIDFTNHGRPAEHDSPHQHIYKPNPTGGTPERGKDEPFQ